MSSLLTAVILAAGKGTRMKSAKAKVLHRVFFRPMIHYVLDAVNNTSVNNTVLVIGHQKDQVRRSIEEYSLNLVVQEQQLGTGHAVQVAEAQCNAADHVLILYGDTPLIRSESLEEMIAQHQQNKAVISLMTTNLDDPFGYGRVIKNSDGNILRIVEQKDADAQEQKIETINTGIYLVQKDFLFDALKRVDTNNSQGEIYLTDIIALAVEAGHQVYEYAHPEAKDVLGVNSRIEQAEAHQELLLRRNHKLMLDGITMLSPESTVITPEVSLGGDCVIHAGVHIYGKSVIGSDCIIGPGVIMNNCRVGDGVKIGAHAVLEHCALNAGASVAPLTYRKDSNTQ